ncbi:MAG: hypothetical protein D6748_01025 [Calditrichaeota bacterium]|nr:MAG: hypothetical protein D6748_01025 [Calditrichota bacterium]
MKLQIKKHHLHWGLMLVMVFLIACTPNARYKILGIFFDGVPNPEQEQALLADTTLADSVALAQRIFLRNKLAQRQPTYNLHPPYKERKCNQCHDRSQGTNRLKEPMPQLCFSCHTDFSKPYAVMHGPVASGNCTGCHNPHMSKNQKLLTRTGQNICLYCHESKLVFKNEEHEDLEPSDNCTDCHDPHGGDDRFLL